MGDEVDDYRERMNSGLLKLEKFKTVLHEALGRAVYRQEGATIASDDNGEWREIYNDDGDCPDFMLEISPDGSVRLLDNRPEE